jgi:hypothetical protein
MTYSPKAIHLGRPVLAWDREDYVFLEGKIPRTPYSGDYVK